MGADLVTGVGTVANAGLVGAGPEDGSAVGAVLAGADPEVAGSGIDASSSQWYALWYLSADICLEGLHSSVDPFDGFPSCE